MKPGSLPESLSSVGYAGSVAAFSLAGMPQTRNHPRGPAWVKTVSEEGSGSESLAGEAGGVSAV